MFQTSMNFVLSLNTKEDVLKNMSRPTSIAYGKRHTFDALKQLTTNTKLRPTLKIW